MNEEEKKHQKYLEKEAYKANYAGIGLLRCIKNMWHMIVIFNFVLVGSVIFYAFMIFNKF